MVRFSWRVFRCVQNLPARSPGGQQPGLQCWDWIAELLQGKDCLAASPGEVLCAVHLYISHNT